MRTKEELIVEAIIAYRNQIESDFKLYQNIASKATDTNDSDMVELHTKCTELCNSLNEKYKQLGAIMKEFL